MGVDNIIGELFDGRYRLERRIGAGGMADVYLAQDESLHRRVAIKILADRYTRDPGFVERFRREATAAAGLSHPNIVSIYDRGEAEGTYYIAMEYIEGPTLKEEITERAPLPEAEAVGYAVQALQALEFAHRRGVIHRDIKPHNMMLTPDGLLKVTDFGIARATNEVEMTEVGSIVGTAQYLSPEQARGHSVGPQSDIYSMGVVLYEMLTGEVPFTGSSAVEIAMKQVNEAPQPPSSKNRLITHGLEQVVMRALAKDPALRFHSAREMADELERTRRGLAVSQDTAQATAVIGAYEAAQATSVMGAQPPAAPPPPPQAKRSAVPWLLVALLLLASAVVGYVVYQQLQGSDQVKVPDVRGFTKQQAQTQLIQAGFTTAVEHKASKKVAKGQVIDTDPTHGSEADKGSKVTIIVSKGPKSVTLPNLRGKSVSRGDPDDRQPGSACSHSDPDHVQAAGRPGRAHRPQAGRDPAEHGRHTVRVDGQREGAKRGRHDLRRRQADAGRVQPAGQLHEHAQRHRAGRPGDQPVARRGQPGPAGQHRVAPGLVRPIAGAGAGRDQHGLPDCQEDVAGRRAARPALTLPGVRSHHPRRHRGRDRPAGGHDGRPQVRRDRVRGRLDVDHSLSVSERPRIRVAVLGGGRSSEHEVSLRSAASVVAALDPERFDVVPVQIDRGGAWQIESSARLSLEPGAESRSLVPSAPAGLPAPAGIGPIDVVLPILHGPFGEDGRLQGLLDMINIPYVGSGVAASALTMDKDKVKYVLRGVGIAVADHVVLRNRRFGAADAEAVERLGYPCFVKPANLGSSVGISKVTAPDGLAAAVELAFRHDRTVLVEEMIAGREVELGVLGNSDPLVSPPGEIVIANDSDWYDYSAKYDEGAMRLRVPADLPESVTAELQDVARRAFEVCGCSGMARIDFFVTPEHRVVLNEINTIPGFTSTSVYAELFEAIGISYPQLLERLIELALERHADDQTYAY